MTFTDSPRSILSYNTNKDQIPSRIKPFDARSRQEILNTNRSLVYNIQSHFTIKNVKPPMIVIAPLKEEDLHSFWSNSSIDVKNIAYKPSTGSTLFSAYCAATYAANNTQN